MKTIGYDCDRCGQHFDGEPKTTLHRNPAPEVTAGKLLTFCWRCDEAMMKWLRAERATFGIRALPYSEPT